MLTETSATATRRTSGPGRPRTSLIVPAEIWVSQGAVAVPAVLVLRRSDRRRQVVRAGRLVAGGSAGELSSSTRRPTPLDRGPEPPGHGLADGAPTDSPPCRRAVALGGHGRGGRRCPPVGPGDRCLTQPCRTEPPCGRRGRWRRVPRAVAAPVKLDRHPRPASICELGRREQHCLHGRLERGASLACLKARSEVAAVEQHHLLLDVLDPEGQVLPAVP